MGVVEGENFQGFQQQGFHAYVRHEKDKGWEKNWILAGAKHLGEITAYLCLFPFSFFSVAIGIYVCSFIKMKGNAFASF
jgi:hypothetical protein